MTTRTLLALLAVASIPAAIALTAASYPIHRHLGALFAGKKDA